MAPSSMSASVKNQMARNAHHNFPIGNSVNAAITVPAVPMMVTASGVSPAFSATRANGALSLV